MSVNCAIACIQRFLFCFFLFREGGQLDLRREFFYQVKPGLSAYANDPKQVSNKKNAILILTAR